ncbi:MAG: cyclic nucleotide-binding domain-containing protein [Gemmatimonadetes bacterium]|jgi:CRP-like cAMP-binding protein|nr:cyclic nucleotide-binding domain-containing protein [Gemmatimonadota bacterium]MBT4609260.1 cyclic nucleotide-binding domain-containing protein [Gemmatimonadota bacterium]MBT5145304.1 cyclic nucleotide-binding domain-containing protein [Gemmatimonadota bacterium]MBT7454280.1 cyclic nucleotide-binding domain-containing protein [Gemmatimonadota bacterium]MBT7594796.1 cyclic nucleotide-binding domain-containing protein [Gemmatimonadota bacterium]
MSATDRGPITDPEWENFFARSGDNADSSLEKLLSKIAVFDLLRPRELKKLARIVHVREFRRGETVIQRGALQSGFYLIRSGSVNIVRERDDRREVVATLHPPELLGEFSLLDDSPRSTSIVAAEQSELIGFFKPDLMDIIATSPETGCMILLRLAEEMTHSLNKDYDRLREMGFPFDDEEEAPEMDPTA